MRVCTGALFVLLLVGSWSARAQQPMSAGQADLPNGRDFRVAPYLWFPTVDVSLNYRLPPVLGGRLPTNVSVGPGDIYSHFDIGAMVSADAQYGPFSLLTDFVGARFSATTSNVTIKSIDFFGRSPIPLSRDLETSTGTTLKMIIWTLAAATPWCSATGATST